MTVASTTCTVVRSENVGGPSLGDGAPSDCQASSRNTTGTASAVSFSQYWKACTNVMLRMPPVATLNTTTTATSRPPTQLGAPVVRLTRETGADQLRQQVEPADRHDQDARDPPDGP